MNLKECLQFMIDGGYLMSVNNKLLITNAVYREVDTSVLKKTVSLGIIMNNKDLFMKFMKEARVPYRLPFGNGSFYTVGSYSKTAEKCFMKAYKTKDLNYEELVKATKQYYNSQNSNKVTILKYFQEGIWEGDSKDKELFVAETKLKIKDKINLLNEECENEIGITFVEGDLSELEELTGNDISDLMALGLLVE